MSFMNDFSICSTTTSHININKYENICVVIHEKTTRTRVIMERKKEIK